MSDSNQQENPLFSSEVVYQLPYPGEVKTGLHYSDNESLVMDVYYPANRVAKMPVVVFVTGYPDPGYQAKVGVQIKDLPQMKSWARLFAASGVVAITYANTDPGKDVFTLLTFLKSHQNELDIDVGRMAFWSCSGNVPNALGVLAKEEGIRGAVLAYGFMLDSEDSDQIAQAGKAFGFAYPGSVLDQIPVETPLFIIRAGMDQFEALNKSIDNFLQQSMSRNMAVSLCNFRQGVHAFDILDDSAESQRVVKRMLEFVVEVVA